MDAFETSKSYFNMNYNAYIILRRRRNEKTIINFKINDGYIFLFKLTFMSGTSCLTLKVVLDPVNMIST